jgi:AcrR family transcriptional regulator
VTETWDDSLEAHRGRQRRAIYDATLSLVTERGLSDVSMAEVARQAGIGRATLYKYFPSVEHILAAVALDEMDRERATLDAALVPLDDPLERLRTSTRLLIEYFDSPDHALASGAVHPTQFSEEVGRDVHAAFRSLHEMLADMVRDAIDEDHLRPDLDPDFAAEALGQLLAAGRTMVMSGRMDASTAADAVMEFFLDGAAPR